MLKIGHKTTKEYNEKMEKDKYKIILEKIPSILTTYEDVKISFEKALTELKAVLDYDSAYICYLNSDTSNIQYKKTTENAEPLKDGELSFVIDSCIKDSFYEKKPLLFDENSEYFTGCGFQKTNSNFLIAKLHLRDTVFGFIMLVRKTPFSMEDADITDKFCAVVSYAIKDSELANVFKLQLKALQESILEKSRAYATIKKQNEKILEADKIKNDFLANISHELRTPLNAIIGFSEALAKKFFGDLNKKQSEYVNDIHVSGIHLLGMINEILEISKIESKAVKLALSTFSLTMSITEVVNIVTPLANKKNIELKVDIPEDAEIKADYQKIQQILYNLLSNAIKFTKENGKIETGYTKKGDSVEIYVKDNGIGIDKKYHGKIFAKFVQLNNIYSKKESSTGLGLTITKELVELHGGKITFESMVDVGSTFYVTLPLEAKLPQENE